MLSGPGAEWRSTLPIKYMIIDFDLSVCSKDKKGPGQGFLVEGYEMMRYACYLPPEVKQSGFDPYAADVFQTGKMLRDVFLVSDALHQKGEFDTTSQNATGSIPGLPELLQDMTDDHPEQRISMAAAIA